MSLGFYWKQLSVFVLLATVVTGGLWYIKSSQSSEASVRRTPIPNTQVAHLTIALQDGGGTTVNGDVFSGLIRFEPGRQVFDYQAFEKDGSFVDQLTTTVSLPRTVDPTQLVARHTGSFGVITEEPLVTAGSVTYVVRNLSPNATYRMELVMPAGTILPSFLGQVLDRVRNLSPGWWLSIALGLPLLALIVLGVMFSQALRSWRGPIIIEERTTPPVPDGSHLSPALVAILVTGKVSPRSLAATLLDLAARGHLQVVHHRQGFTFGKRFPVDFQTQSGVKADPLNRFELILLEKLFTGTALRSTATDIDLRLGQHIFSRKIAQAYLAMYDAAVAERWFVQNPEVIYRGFRSLALLVIAMAMVGFVLSLLFGPEPYFYLLGWAGLFFVGLIMHQITPFLPRRTRLGDEQYRAWVAFRNYLSSRRTIGTAPGGQLLYERFLSYAVAMGVEVEWTQRFLGAPFHVPDWYSSDQDIYLIEDFANNLFPIVGSVASDFARAREPQAV